MISIHLHGPLSLHFPQTTNRNDAVKLPFQLPLHRIQTSKPRNFKLPVSKTTPLNWWNLPNESTQHLNNSNNSVRAVTLWEFLLQLWKLIDNHHWTIFLGFASLTVAAVSEISMPSILAASVFCAQGGDMTSCYRNVRLLFMLCIFSGISSGLRSGCFAIADVTLVKCLREVLYSVLIHQDMEFFDKEDVGGLASRLGTDCQRLSSVIGKDIHLIVRNSLQGMGALINLLSLSWPLAMSSVLVCLVLAAIFSVYARYQRLAAKLTQDFSACANQAAEESISLIRTVRIHGTESLELGRYRHWLEKITFISLRESMAFGLSNMSFNILYRSSQIFAVLLGGMSIMAGHVSTEQLTKYVLYCEWLIYATWRVVDNTVSLFQAMGASEKVFQLIQLSPGDVFLSKGVKLQRPIGEFQFVDVSFCYPSRLSVPVLENMNLSVKANEVVAVVGLSGSGKTTLVNLLLRLYEPSKGQIFIDGFPLPELDIRWFRENIGYVQQEPKLFHMDVKSNITYGCNHDVKEEDIVWAAKLAHAHEFISYLPNGYQTIIDENLLSRGQKQRIAIARAILRNPSVLILDEATSALDPESEHFVKDVTGMFKNLNEMKRIVIVIAHRLSTIKAADRIIVMDGGRIVETGNHKELLLRGGLYSKLMKTQADLLA